jgi:hypothetical protein
MCVAKKSDRFQTPPICKVLAFLALRQVSLWVYPDRLILVAEGDPD